MLFASLIALVGFVFYSAPIQTVGAANREQLCSGANLDITGDTKACNETGKKTAAEELEATISAVVNILSVIVAVASVIMIILGGFRYVTSGGDSGSVGNAKNTIIYALVGLVIVALAQLIVKFVVAKLAG
jgi:Type IV secretion system pilin